MGDLCYNDDLSGGGDFCDGGGLLISLPGRYGLSIGSEKEVPFFLLILMEGSYAIESHQVAPSSHHVNLWVSHGGGQPSSSLPLQPSSSLPLHELPFFEGFPVHFHPCVLFRFSSVAFSFVCLPQSLCLPPSLFHHRFSAVCTFSTVDLSSTVAFPPSFFRCLHALRFLIGLHRPLCKVSNIKMKRGEGEVKTRTSDRLRDVGITSRKSLATGIQNLSSSSEERTEDIMAEGSGGKRESLGTSKKRVRTETKKEEATVQKKQRIKSLVSRRRVHKGKGEGKKQKEVEGKV
uniref:Uncharacterized protein n=1 Tax=Cucumis melo TaxID=3656 RepID=A0A9I9EJ17_CUCME